MNSRVAAFRKFATVIDLKISPSYPRRATGGLQDDCPDWDFFEIIIFNPLIVVGISSYLAEIKPLACVVPSPNVMDGVAGGFCEGSILRIENILSDPRSISIH